jgi:hypothetical protein
MGWLNSDDLLLPNSLLAVGKFFRDHPDVDVVYGSRIIIDDNTMEIGRWVVPPNCHEYLEWADYIPQETVFWRRELWNLVGGRLDEDFSFAMDWELLLRFVDSGATFAHIDSFLGAFRVHHASKTISSLESRGAREMMRLRTSTHGRFVPHSELRRKLSPLYRAARKLRRHQI